MEVFTPRPSQREILKYTSGTLGISAVPGSGKTHTLSALAAQIISSGQLEPDQEVLIVTLVNSAVDNFAARIKESLALPMPFGYRIRTLHGLAHDIVREKPAAVGLEDRFAILDEREADFIRKEAATAWLHANPDFANSLTTGKTDYAYKGIAEMFKHAYSICHVKAMEPDEKGQLVHVDMARTFGILKSSNFKGYCSMEFDSPGDPNQGTSDLIDQTLKFLA